MLHKSTNKLLAQINISLKSRTRVSQRSVSFSAALIPPSQSIEVSCRSFSINTNVKTVCGLENQLGPKSERKTYVSLNQAGVQPLIRNRGPSSLRPVLRTRARPSFPALDCILLLRTSAGAHRVVAIVPAARDEIACVFVSSPKPLLTRYCLAEAYLSC